MKANRFNFRAWHPSLKEMCVFIFSENIYDAEVMAHFSFLAKNDHPEGKNLLMQSTGLTDRNEVEIFEGDIVMWAKESNLCPEETWCGPSPVRWDHSEYDIAGYGMPYKSYEVIGNIHENPELLEAT